MIAEKSNPIIRVKVTPKDVAVPIQYIREDSLGENILKYEKLHSFETMDLTANLDILWK